jgi:hypothetical protein
MKGGDILDKVKKMYSLPADSIRKVQEIAGGDQVTQSHIVRIAIDMLFRAWIREGKKSLMEKGGK